MIKKTKFQNVLKKDVRIVLIKINVLIVLKNILFQQKFRMKIKKM